MSAKFRVTAWFTLMMVLMAAFIITMIFVVNGASISGDARDRLIKVTEDNAKDIEVKVDSLCWDDLDFYKRGVYTIVYDNRGEALHGGLPDGDIDLPFSPGIIRTVSCATADYYVYDVYRDIVGNELWIRGMIDCEDNSNVMHIFMILLWSLLPSILVLSVCGGWLIAWGAFRPMERIIAAASSISGGDDLSKRIALKRGPSEMKRLAATFDKMLDRLERSFLAQKQFASDASHELRTPVTVILAECDRAHRKNKTVEDYQATLSVVEEQSVRMKELINELLSLTRIELGTERYPLTNNDFSNFVSCCCEEFVPAERKGISLEYKVEEGIRIDCNLSLMAACVNNLLQNAYKYGKENGHIKVELYKEESTVILKFTDDGIGISAENLDKIWQRFWQADPARGSESGSGLGLSLVAEAIRLHNGTITAESKLGQGTCFTIRL